MTAWRPGKTPLISIARTSVRPSGAAGGRSPRCGEPATSTVPASSRRRTRARGSGPICTSGMATSSRTRIAGSHRSLTWTRCCGMRGARRSAPRTRWFASATWRSPVASAPKRGPGCVPPPAAPKSSRSIQLTRVDASAFRAIDLFARHAGLRFTRTIRVKNPSGRGQR